MTVSELIAKLQGCDSTSDIEWSDDQGEIAIEGIEIEDGIVFLVGEEEEEEEDGNG